MGKYFVQILSRPLVEEKIADRKAEFLEKLKCELGGTSLDLSDNGEPVLEDRLGRMSDIKSITRFLPPSASGHLGFKYTGAHYSRDIGSHDDCLELKLNEKKYPLRDFVLNVFVKYIYAFRAYQAKIWLESIFLDDALRLESKYRKLLMGR